MTSLMASDEAGGVRFRTRIPIGGMVSGAVLGLAILVLLQQFGTVYPSRAKAIGALIGGAVAMLVLANLVRALAVTSYNRRQGSGGPADAAGAPAAEVGGWAPGHRIGADGADAFERPGDDAGPAAAHLDARLDVEVVDRWGDWAMVRCSNGWTGWVDGHVLVEFSGDDA